MWHKNKFTLFNKGESNLKTTEELFELISSEVKANKYNLVVIDNLMSILSVEKQVRNWKHRLILLRGAAT